MFAEGEVNIGEYSPRRIFTNIHETEANNCFSILLRRLQKYLNKGMLQFYHNLPLLIGVHTMLLASLCHTIPFWTRALKKKTFSLMFIPGKNKSKCGFVVCTLIDNGYASLLFSLQTMFSYCFCMLSEFAKVFERKSDAYK